MGQIGHQKSGVVVWRKAWWDAVVLLRIPFSVYLSPVFFMALSQSIPVNTFKAVLVFVISHLLVFPGSNAINSYYDQDDTPIGSLKRPPVAGANLLLLANLTDAAGLLLAFTINAGYGIMSLLYICVSRAYSYPATRLKADPVLSTLAVALFQGMTMYFGYRFAFLGKGYPLFNTSDWALGLFSSLTIAAGYPLTQLYQLDDDKARGDLTLARLLGVRGSLAFTLICFLGAAGCLFWFDECQPETLPLTPLFMLVNLPVVVAFLWTAWPAYKNEVSPTYEQVHRITNLSAVCLGLTFIVYAFLAR